MKTMNIGIDWETRRNVISHDWLQNIFIVRIDGLIERLRKREIDREVLHDFFTIDFPAWSGKSQEFLQLLNDFENEKSPKAVAISRLPSYASDWLGEGLHQLWMLRNHITVEVASCEGVLKKCNQQHRLISLSLKGFTSPSIENSYKMLSAIENFRHELIELRDGLRKLSNIQPFVSI